MQRRPVENRELLQHFPNRNFPIPDTFLKLLCPFMNQYYLAFSILDFRCFLLLHSLPILTPPPPLLLPAVDCDDYLVGILNEF